jgi:very-short-patch-repair endonuclease
MPPPKDPIKYKLYIQRQSESKKGKHPSLETLVKLSQSHKGKKQTPEWVAKRVASTLKSETRSEKLSKAFKGKVYPPEFGRKISTAKKGKPSPTKGIIKKPERRIEIWFSKLDQRIPRKKEISIEASKRLKDKPGTFTGRRHRQESIELMRQSHLGKSIKYTEQGLQNIIKACKERVWSEESLKKISLSKIGIPRPEHVRQAMLKASIGRVITAETRKKLSIASIGRTWSEESKQKLREKRKNWKIPYYDTKPERMMHISLALNNIKFQKHIPFKIGKRWHQVDIFIVPNIIVEVDGINWHIPIDRIKRDLYQTQELTLMGYHVIRIRDLDILKDANHCAEKVIGLIKEIQHRPLVLSNKTLIISNTIY